MNSMTLFNSFGAGGISSASL